jgi:hypothetical protein
MSQFYVGVKQVFAYPEEKSGQAGYHVVYDYGTPREYHSWSPKGVFEAAYLPMGENNDGSRVTQEMVDGFLKLAEAVTVGGKMTVVNAELASGTVFAESSACVDPKNYDEQLGKQICVERIKTRIWHLLGFALQWARNGLNR